MSNSLVKAQLKSTRKPAKSPAPKPTPKGAKQDTLAVPYSMSPSKEDIEYKAREDARTLHEAHRIRQDKGRMKAASDHILSMSEALSGPVKQVGRKRG